MTPELPSILIVEDNSDDLLLIQRAFRKANLQHPIVSVSNGEEAIAYLDGKGAYADRTIYPMPAAMLLDVRLPRKSGLDVLEWTRAQPALANMPIVMLVSGAGADIKRSQELGATGHLRKPVYAESLRATIITLNMNWHNHLGTAVTPPSQQRAL